MTTVGTAAKYLPIIKSMSEAEVASEIVNPRELLLDRYLYKSTRLEIAYAPFDYINTRAKIVIVGITPGKHLMQKAIEEARKLMRRGLCDAEVLKGAKACASFAGPMRKNLVKLMDAVGLNEFLNLSSTASLCGADGHCAHFTSALRYPTFVNGQNYSRSPHVIRVPFLLDYSSTWLAEELSLLPNAVIVPMGDMVTDVMAHIGGKLAISSDRILAGIPHASGANNGPISRFLGCAGPDDKWRDRFREIKAKVKNLDRCAA